MDFSSVPDLADLVAEVEGPAGWAGLNLEEILALEEWAIFLRAVKDAVYWEISTRLKFAKLGHETWLKEWRKRLE